MADATAATRTKISMGKANRGGAGGGGVKGSAAGGAANGGSDESSLVRKPSTRNKAVVDYDEQRHLGDAGDKAVRPPYQSTSASGSTSTNTQPSTASTNTGLSELEERVIDLGDSWETESLFVDAIQDLAEDKFFTDETDACTPEEAVYFRQLLRAVGPEVFSERTVQCGRITARKLLTAFGIRPPAFLEGAADDAYYSLLSLALTRELSKRAKLTRYNTVDDAVDLLRTSRNIIVLTGAGISTSLGIPDFRSKGTGLYSKLEHLGLSDPQEVFDITVFREDPSIFYSVARDILPDQDRFSPTHAFIALLQQQGKLLTNYSQNIDNLEAKAGIRPEKLVQCHGSFATATCQKCGHKVVGDTLFTEIKAGRIPRCGACARGRRPTVNSGGGGAGGGPGRKRKLLRDGTEKKVRRVRQGDYDTASDSEYDSAGLGPGDASCGVMKPDITFFGEPLPDEFTRRLTEDDRDLVDLVIVIGTSLKVAPVSEVVPYLPPQVPQICISRMPVSHVNFDIDLLGDCDVVVAELCRRAGWPLRHEMVPARQRVAVELADGYASRHIFTQVHPPPPGSGASAGAGGQKQEGAGGERVKGGDGDDDDDDEDEDENENEDEEDEDETNDKEEAVVAVAVAAPTRKKSDTAKGSSKAAAPPRQKRKYVRKVKNNVKASAAAAAAAKARKVIK